VKKSDVSEWHKRFEVLMSKSQMKTVLITFSISSVLFTLNYFHEVR